MIKKILVLTLITSTSSFGNINYIRFEKIPEFHEYDAQINFLKQNLQYFDHWQPEWTYDISKKSLVQGLVDGYDKIAAVDDNNLERVLLLADIAHYLYNLEEEEYFEISESLYKRAIKLAPNDYRGYWFIAQHYSLANVIDNAILYYLEAEKLLPIDAPVEFWENYSFGTALANMPSHSIHSMDKSREILGGPGYFEEKLGNNVKNRIKPVNADSTYTNRELWTVADGDLLSFISRPLGLKLLIDSTWRVSIHNYQNHQSGLTLIPPALKNNQGREITYTIAILMKVAQNGDNLNSYIDRFVAKFPAKKTDDFTDRFEGTLSFEIQDKNLYHDIGGAHFQMIGIERDKPKYPGLLLEEPVLIPQGNSEQVSFYRAGDTKDRFDGVIYYAIMLDVCEDIYSEAYKVFKQFFETQLIIE